MSKRLLGGFIALIGVILLKEYVCVWEVVVYMVSKVTLLFS